MNQPRFRIGDAVVIKHSIKNHNSVINRRYFSSYIILIYPPITVKHYNYNYNVYYYLLSDILSEWFFEENLQPLCEVAGIPSHLIKNRSGSWSNFNG